MRIRRLPKWFSWLVIAGILGLVLPLVSAIHDFFAVPLVLALLAWWRPSGKRPALIYLYPFLVVLNLIITLGLAGFAFNLWPTLPDFMREVPFPSNLEILATLSLSPCLLALWRKKEETVAHWTFFAICLTVSSSIGIAGTVWGYMNDLGPERNNILELSFSMLGELIVFFVVLGDHTNCVRRAENAGQKIV